jgi:isoquinoline 1-oxidoreductase beta subunit
MNALSRRDFLRVSALAGGGLLLETLLPNEALGKPAVSEVTAWLLIHPNDRVVIRVARTEMGQGSFTALAQLVAEELECDWAKVTAEYADPNEHFRRNKAWGSMATGGSMGIRSSHDYVRQAGATARELLKSAAAAKWKVPVSECTTAKGVITHGPSKRTLRYGEVATAAAALKLPEAVALKDPKTWTIAGTSPQRLDIPDKVRGLPVFAADVTMKGLLHASIAQCPIFGGTLKSLDAASKAAALKRRGVKQVVEGKDFVAVLADNWWRADQALRSLSIEWDGGANAAVSSDSIAKQLAAGLTDAKAVEALKTGDVAVGFQGAAKVVEADYFAPFLNHATMEPQTCTAWVKPDGTVEAWVPTQNGEASMEAVAEAAGVPLDKVYVHKTMLGGGFGRRGAYQDYAKQAVALSKAAGNQPVKLFWSRSEDMQHGFYRPAAKCRLKGALDAKGKLVALDVTVACPSILDGLGWLKGAPVDRTSVSALADHPYTVPHVRVRWSRQDTPVPVGFWRSVGYSQNPFFRECFIDELAHAAKQDPVAFRRAMLKPGDKQLAVLDAVAKAAGWDTPLPKGVFRGVALQDGYGSFAAAVVEVSVSPAGDITVLRSVVALDSGHVVHPDNCLAQAQGNTVYGLSAALWGENTIKDGRVEQSNFHDYRVMALKEMPKVELVLVPSGGFWGGHGEPGLIALAPALGNALFAATGQRFRAMPLAPAVKAWASAKK